MIKKAVLKWAAFFRFGKIAHIKKGNWEKKNIKYLVLNG